MARVGVGGALLFASYLGGSGTDLGSGIAVDGSGNAFVAGMTSSADFPTPGGIDTTLGGTGDAFVTKIVNSPPTLTTVALLLGAVEDQPFTITYATLAGAADEADSDGDTLSFRIEAVTTGTLTEGGVPVVPGTTLLSPGESLVWTPAANANGAVGAFTVVAWDGRAASAAAVPVNVNVAAVNDAPTLTTVATLSNGVEDQDLTISYATLAAAADEADVDGDPLSFRIEAVSSGTLTKGGVPVVPGDTLGTGEDLVWRPALNANGTLRAFTVVAWDGQAPSATAVPVNVGVAPVNDPPTLTTVTTLPGGVENQDFTITYATLAGAADEADIEGDPLSFLIDGVSTGTLTKNGLPVVPGVTLLSAGESLVWRPATDANGTLQAFTVRAWDGHSPSAPPVQVSVAVAPSNIPPTLTTVAPLLGGVEDQDYTITYAALAAAANEADPNGDPLSFRIEAVSSGILTKGGAPVVPGTTLLSTGETLVWRPAIDANGTLEAFTVVAWDGKASSGTPVPVNVQVAPVNDAPAFTKGADAVANEDAGLQTLVGWATGISPGPADEAGQLVDFLVTNSNNALFTVQPAIAPDGTLTFVSAPDAHGAAIVTVKIHDDGGTANGGVDTSADQTFTITVNSVNDVPSFTKGPDQTVLPGVGLQTVPNWATNIGPGPADETGQAVDFIVAHDYH
ncbi:MAG: hypothetical protein FJ291_34100, partial [Planctomycetes bacterium]|nr:hypothetical protein [Planctomycetota bacterium]